MQQEQPQYYRAVPVSKKPKKDGYYMLARERHSELTNEPYTDTYYAYFLEGDWFENEEEARGYENHDAIDVDDFTHWLEPIFLIDAPKLRDALTQKDQCFKAVPVSHPPKQPDLYHTLIENESLGIEGLPCHNNYIGDPNGGYWEIDGDSKVTHYLEPIHTPDAAVLRSALEKLTQFNEGMVIGLEAEYGLESEAIEIFRPQIKAAREALSAVGDGWVRVEDGGFSNDQKYLLFGIDWPDCVIGEYWSAPEYMTWHDASGETLHEVTHFRPLPSRPLNK